MHNSNSGKLRIRPLRNRSVGFCNGFRGRYLTLVFLFGLIGSGVISEEDSGFCPISSGKSKGCDTNSESVKESSPTKIMASQQRERTFLMVKPDGVQRGIVGEIIKRFEQKGFKLVALKFQLANEELLNKHYEEHIGKPFFPKLLKYISSGPVVPMVWEGEGVIKTARQMMGATNPSDAVPGTLRGDFCIIAGRNVIHGSDSLESSTREINLWFKEGELVDWRSNSEPWIYE